MPNGTYNMIFRIYSVASGGTALWTETHAVSASQGIAVTTGGLFSVQLGSVTSLPPSIFNTTSPLYLEVELPTPATATSTSPSWTEGAMSPRNPIESSPYAINADQLDGLDSSAFAAASGSANYLQNTTSPQIANFDITGVGTAATLQAANFDTASSGALTIGTSNATSISLAQNTSIAAGKSLTLTGGITSTRPSSPTNGMLYYDTSTKQLLQYNGTKWVGSQKAAIIVAANNSTQAQKDAADYIATGTSDQTTIASAVTALGSSGGTVYLLSGTYNFSASLSITTANITLTGDSQATIVRGFDGTSTSNGGLVYPNGSYDIVSNITLNGNSTTYTNASYDIGIEINNGQNQVVQGLVIKNMAGYGIRTDGAGPGANGRFLQNIISNSGTGIWIDSPTGAAISYNTITGSVSTSGEVGGIVNHNASSIMMSNNTVSGGASNGIQGGRAAVTGNVVTSNAGIGIKTGSSSAISGNTVTSNNIGILSGQGYTDISITGNYVASNTTYGIEYDTSGSGSSVVINDNNVVSNGYDGILLHNTPCNATVQNNRVSNNGGTGSYNGITVNTGCSTTIITGNYITDTAGTGYAISINAGTGTYLSGNTYSGTGASSIFDNAPGTIWSNQIDANGNIVNKNIGALTVGTGTVSGTLSLQGAITAAQLASPSAPTITNGGTAGTVSYSYAVTAYDGVGETLASSNGTTSTGNAALSATNYNTITWTEIPGATKYKVYRTATSGTPATTGLIATVTATANGTTFLNDTGLAASGTVPTVNSTGGASFSGTTTIQSANNANAFSVQSVAGTNVLSVDTTTNTVTLGSASSGNYLSFTSSGGLVANGTAQHTKTITLTPEYAGAVLDASSDATCSSANNGTMTSGYNSTKPTNYYQWVSTLSSAQCYDVVVQVPIPSDFSSWSGTPNIQMEDNGTGTGAYAIQIIPSSGSDANYGSYVSPGTLGTSWGNMATSALSGTYTPGTTMTVKVRMSSTNSAAVQLGTITLTYKSAF